MPAANFFEGQAGRRLAVFRLRKCVLYHVYTAFYIVILSSACVGVAQWGVAGV